MSGNLGADYHPATASGYVISNNSVPMWKMWANDDQYFISGADNSGSYSTEPAIQLSRSGNSVYTPGRFTADGGISSQVSSSLLNGLVVCTTAAQSIGISYAGTFTLRGSYSEQAIYFENNGGSQQIYVDDYNVSYVLDCGLTTTTIVLPDPATCVGRVYKFTAPTAAPGTSYAFTGSYIPVVRFNTATGLYVTYPAITSKYVHIQAIGNDSQSGGSLPPSGAQWFVILS